jgi:NAD(P)H dehydrogenase (quinone)
MFISIILAHPDKSSLNHAIAGVAVEQLQRNGHRVAFHDLHAEGFDPALEAREIPRDGTVPPSIRKHCDEIMRADGIVIVHPNWWGQPPAVMKGWIDRVLRPGVAYGFVEGDSGEGVPVGLLKAKAALVFNTSNTPPERERQAFGDPLESTWKRCIFGLCGVTNVHRETFSVVVTSTPEQRQAWLERVRHLVDEYFPQANKGRD